MKKTILTCALIFIAFIANAQLNSNANFVKENSPEIYNKIKILVSKDWEGDHKMMVYVINQQADAVLKCVEIQKRKDYDDEIMLKALGDWAEDIKGVFCVDYKMVVYTYEQQIKAKDSY
jgi:hypothetical protein